MIRGTGKSELAPFFAPAVRHWSDEIKHWSAQHDVDPHLLATVMQIESCGHPTVISNAPAPRVCSRSCPFILKRAKTCSTRRPTPNEAPASSITARGQADGVVGLTLACYNGGPSVINRARDRWSSETQKILSLGSRHFQRRHRGRGYGATPSTSGWRPAARGCARARCGSWSARIRGASSNGSCASPRAPCP